MIDKIPLPSFSVSDWKDLVFLIVIAIAVIAWLLIKYAKHASETQQKSQRPSKTIASQTFEQVSQEAKSIDTPCDVKLGIGEIKAICFRRINGINVVDFTTIEKPIGELYQVDPSAPVPGAHFIVKEMQKDDTKLGFKAGDIVDYDPRKVPYDVENSPERAWLAINPKAITKAFWYVNSSWWKSPVAWMAIVSVIIAFFFGMAVIG